MATSSLIAQGLDSVYLFSTFISPQATLRICYSQDGVNWANMSDNAVYNPGGGDGVRDPHLWFSGGYYYVAFTAGNFGFCNYWMIARSKDLLNWTTFATIPMTAVTGANQVWFGTYFLDPATGIEHFFTAVSTNQVSPGGSYTSSAIYEQHPVTPGDYSSMSAPVLVTGTSLPTKIIAESVVLIGGNYRFFIKNDTTTDAYCMTSASLLSGYTLGSIITAWNATEGVGGPIQTGATSWRAFLDHGDGIRYSDSTDNFATWSAPLAVSSKYTYANTGAISTSAPAVLVNLLMAAGSNNNSQLSQVVFAGLYIGTTFDPNLAVHLKPDFGTDGQYFFDSITGQQMNCDFGRGGTKRMAFIVDGSNTFRMLSRTLNNFMTTWKTETDGSLHQQLGGIFIEGTNNTLNIASIPTSSSGLASGTVWSNLGILTIVP